MHTIRPVFGGPEYHHKTPDLHAESQRETTRATAEGTDRSAMTVATWYDGRASLLLRRGQMNSAVARRNVSESSN